MFQTQNAVEKIKDLCKTQNESNQVIFLKKLLLIIFKNIYVYKCYQQ